MTKLEISSHKKIVNRLLFRFYYNLLINQINSFSNNNQFIIDKFHDDCSI